MKVAIQKKVNYYIIITMVIVHKLKNIYLFLLHNIERLERILGFLT